MGAREKILEWQEKSRKFDQRRNQLESGKFQCVMVNDDKFFIASILPHLMRNNHI